MDIFKGARVTMAAQRLQEEALYSDVAKELAAGIRRDGLWAQALVEAKGDQDYARAVYLKNRVQSMKDEALVGNFLKESCQERKATPSPEPQAQESLSSAKKAHPNQESPSSAEAHPRFVVAKQILKSKGYVILRDSRGGWQAWCAHNKHAPRKKLSNLDEVERFANLADGGE